MITTTAQVLATFSPTGLLQEMLGQDREIQRICAVEECGPGDLVFLDKADYVPQVTQRRPSAIVTTPALAKALKELPDTTLLVTASVNLAHALIKQRWGARRFEDAGWPRIHPSAVVHETASVDPTAVIEPRAVIGRNVQVGARTRIMAGAVIENDAKLGSDTVVHPNAVIGYSCILGNQVSVGAGSVLGSEGYGFAQDRQGKSHPIPQTGIVEVGDRVRIGANCCIDRAAYRVTRIGAGTKIDNLCHIAHNVQIGQDCLLTSMFCIAGSSEVGSRVMASGQTGVTDHVKICDDVMLVHRAGITKDITRPGVYGGAPAQPMSEYMRFTAALRTVPDLRKRVQQLEKNQAQPDTTPPAAPTAS